MYDDEPPATTSDDKEPSYSSDDAKRRSKPRDRIQPIVVRLRTQLCKLPRERSLFVPGELFQQMLHTFLTMDSNNDQELVADYVECHHVVMQRAPHFSILPFRKDAAEMDPNEFEAGTPLLRLCLIPHVSYSFDLSITPSWGKHLIEEHTHIIR